MYERPMKRARDQKGHRQSINGTQLSVLGIFVLVSNAKPSEVLAELLYPTWGSKLERQDTSGYWTSRSCY